MKKLDLQQQNLDDNQFRDNQQPNRVRFHHENLKDLLTHRSLRHTNISVTSLGSQSGGRGSCYRELSNLNQLRDQKKVSKSIQRSNHDNTAGQASSAFGNHPSYEEEKELKNFEKTNNLINNFQVENKCGNDKKYSEIELNLQLIQQHLNKMNEISDRNFEGSSDSKIRMLLGSFQNNISSQQSNHGDIKHRFII